MKTLLLLITAVVMAGGIYAEESTLRLVGVDLLAETQVKCASCGTMNPSTNKFCGTCGMPLLKDDSAGSLFFKAGGYIPTNAFMMNTYGTSIIYGVGLNLSSGWLGVKLEFEDYTLERLIPITTFTGTPSLGDWRSATTKLSVAPVWVSAYASSNFKEWKGYFGLGIGVAMIREEYKGDYYFKATATAAPDWGYADSIARDSLWCAEAYIGIIKSEKIGFDVKLMYIPSQGKFQYSDLGGVATTIGIYF